MNDRLIKRADGTFEESLGEAWVARYTENEATGLWEVEVFEHDVVEWRSTGYGSIDDCRRAALEYYDQI